LPERERFIADSFRLQAVRFKAAKVKRQPLLPWPGLWRRFGWIVMASERRPGLETAAVDVRLSYDSATASAFRRGKSPPKRSLDGAPSRVK